MTNPEERIADIKSPASSPQRHHRLQASLKDVLDLASTAQAPLGPVERATARRTFFRVVEHLEATDPFRSIARVERATSYSQPLLVRHTYEYALSDESRDIFLRAFFASIELDLTGAHPELDFEVLTPRFNGFADYLVDNFFLPLKASTRKTPQPSPAYHSAVLSAQEGVTTAHGFIGTSERLASLRWECLVRDRHRCVITRHFSSDEYEARFKLDGNDASDDDGILFSEQTPGQLAPLEVAHILPHSLMKLDRNAEMDASRQAALAILNMFDKGVAHIINGVDIDRPQNALTLNMMLHRYFGAFDVYFEPVPAASNTYRIQSFLSPGTNVAFGLPVTRALFVTESRTIDPPSPRLLAVHRAIAHILHLSGAGDYLDRILRDMGDNYVRADGTSALGHMVALGLHGWTGNAVY
ncbi:hypothetical protein SPBR_08438 [Sporothrix brasiliensis 5110]|uniref:HNH nuclease domain-containing protein n=1 Tax=Sporothrix brasiliensis 5110 TaxID=1398154 RepID=A0A0C2F5R6_9PEZI|nr:uncharacterized protein SPBR_08438 [Sporothrix brasiliensis 5110]KIH86383.1 hypothetical protein SPBR_08438 [Sporothrix brasiliensis 5110]